MKQSWVDSVDCSQRGWVRPCTWASRADSYCASVSHSGKAAQLRGTLWLAGVTVMIICHLAHLREFIDYSVPHFFAQLSVLVQDRQIPEKVLFSDMFANTPFGSSFASCDLCRKNHLGYFQWWLFSYTILSWSQQIKRITLKMGSKGVLHYPSGRHWKDSDKEGVVARPDWDGRNPNPFMRPAIASFSGPCSPEARLLTLTLVILCVLFLLCTLISIKQRLSKAFSRTPKRCLSKRKASAT